MQLAKYFIALSLFLSSPLWAMKTIDLSDKAHLSDEQKITLAQEAANKQDWKAVFNILYPLALEGNLQAQSNLGMLYNLGRGTEQDKEKAYWWFSEAAEGGSIKAINNLAVMYYRGSFVKQDVPQAIKLFETTAIRGKDQDAMLMLGDIYYAQKDYNKSFEWVNKVAAAGNLEGKFRLARMYEEGIGTLANRTLARLLYADILRTENAPDELKEAAAARLARLSR